MDNGGTSLDQDPGFRRYYERHLQPIESQYEQFRLAARKERNKRLCAAVVGWGAGLALVLLWLRPQAEVGWWVFGVLMFLVAVGLAVWGWSPVLAHIGRVKEQVLPRMIPYFGGFRYEWDPELPLAQYGPFCVLPRFNKESVEDLIEGIHLGVPLKAAEIRLREERRVSRSDGTDSTTTSRVFDGLLVEATVGVKFPGTTLVGSAGQFEEYFEILDDTGLELLNSAHGYEIYASGPAREVSVATERLVRELAALEQSFEAKQLVCSFKGNQVVMLIAHEADFFEISSGKETDFVRDAGHIKSQIDKIFDIVERLGFPGPEELPQEARAAQASPLSELQVEADESRYDVGGWGCLGTLILWVAATAVYGILLQPRVQPMALLPWSAAGGFLFAAGLFRLLRSFESKKVGAFLFALILLGGAAWVLYNNWNPAPETDSSLTTDESQPVMPVVQEERGSSRSLPVSNWLEPAPAATDILRSSIELDGTELRHGETANITIRLANNTSNDLNLEVKAALNSLAYLVEASHGGILSGANTQASRWVSWPNLTLPGRRVGQLNLQILVEARYYSDVAVEVTAKDPAHAFEETVQLTLPHDYSEGDGSGSFWFVAIIAGLMMSIVVGVLGQRLDRASRARQVMTRSAAGYIALCFLALGGIMIWNVVSPFFSYQQTHCQVLDARYDEGPMVAVRYDTPAGPQLSTGYAGGVSGGSIGDLEGIDRGYEAECWHHEAYPDRVTLSFGVDWALLVFATIFLALGSLMGWLAVRRKGVPKN